MNLKLTTTVIHSPHMHMPEQTLWCTAAAPSRSSTIPIFALGTSRGLQVVHAQDAHWTLMGYTTPYADRFNLDMDMQSRSESSHVEVTSVEWLSENVVAGGLRDSTVFLHDFRSNASATRLKHPSTVTGMRRVDEWRFVVRGVSVRFISWTLFFPGFGTLFLVRFCQILTNKGPPHVRPSIPTN